MAGTPARRAPTLLFIIGPVAVGKMSVGHADYLRIDNTNRSAEQVAAQVTAHFGLGQQGQ